MCRSNPSLVRSRFVTAMTPALLICGGGETDTEGGGQLIN